MKSYEATSIMLTFGAVVLAVAAPAFCSNSGSILISYKQDPRLASGVYGGERWVAPPTYMTTLQTIDAKAEILDAAGNSTPLKAEWIAEDPEMVAVSTLDAGQVKITVKHAGQSSLKVAAQGRSRTLVVKASSLANNSTQVEITAKDEAPAQTRAGAAAEQALPALKSQKEKLSYALGANLGNGLRRESIDVDSDLVIQGLKDAIAGRTPVLSQHEIGIMLAGLKSELNSKRIVSAAEQINAKKQLAEKYKTDGEAFLAENKNKDGVITLASGLQYKILEGGKGKKPAPGDSVICNYRGTLIDGTEFDSSYQRKAPATFPLNSVIHGWNEALQLMPAGSKWQLFVPANLAYGERGASNTGIPPNATLIFEVELLSIKAASAQGVPVKTGAAAAPRAGTQAGAQ
jgi:FKBP-type peptidyl-prolyl cis-trans isomerase FklB